MSENHENCNYDEHMKEASVALQFLRSIHGFNFGEIKKVITFIFCELGEGVISDDLKEKINQDYIPEQIRGILHAISFIFVMNEHLHKLLKSAINEDMISKLKGKGSMDDLLKMASILFQEKDEAASEPNLPKDLH